MKYLILIITIVFASCQPTDEHAGHNHGEEHRDDHEGHNHNVYNHDKAADSHEEHDEEEIPTVDYTVWTDKTEMFVEFPVLVVGEESRLIAHFTVLDKHKPITEGELTIRLVKKDKEQKQVLNAPSQPGVFTPTVKPKEAGVYQLVFELKTAEYTDKLIIDTVRVYANHEEAKKGIGAEKEESSISFLKEQAWEVDFQTSPVVQKPIYEEILTSGVWKTASSDYQKMIATTSGTVTFKKQNLIEGSLVNKGQVLFSISSEGLTSNNLNAAIRTAKMEMGQAKTILDRKQKLYGSKIISKADFDEANQSYQLAKVNYETLSAGYASGSKLIKAPFSGYIKSIAVANGSFVAQGTELILLSKQKSSVLEVLVNPSYASQLSSIHNVWYQPKADRWSNMKATKGTIVSVGKSVDKDHPLLSVAVQVNDVVEMPEGSFTEVRLAVGKTQNGVVIDENALLENYGAYSVIVQLSGESYERRPVRIGKKNGTEVEILTGLAAGEVVVTKGAYQVKMASMSSQVPAHAHSH